MFLLRAFCGSCPWPSGGRGLRARSHDGLACYLACRVAESDRCERGGVSTGRWPSPTRSWALLPAALPLVAYLLFLLVNLVLNLWHSLLSLPGKLDLLAEQHDQQIGRGQRDTVTTHD